MSSTATLEPDHLWQFGSQALFSIASCKDKCLLKPFFSEGFVEKELVNYFDILKGRLRSLRSSEK